MLLPKNKIKAIERAIRWSQNVGCSCSVWFSDGRGMYAKIEPRAYPKSGYGAKIVKKENNNEH